MSSVYDTPEWAAWLASIKEMPDDDNRRLFAADFLEERGEGERAEFIRVQVELAKTPELVWRNKLLHKAEWQSIRPRAEPWGERFELAAPSDAIGVYHYRETNQNHVRLYGRMSALADGIYGPTLGPLALAGGTWEVDRGFVSRVSGPLVSLIGGECGRCCLLPGDDHTTEPISDIAEDGRTHWHLRVCTNCSGVGTIPGVLRELVKREPVMKFEVTNKDPKFGSTPNFRWTDASEPNPLYSFRSHQQNQLPHELFRLVTGHIKVPNQSPYIKWFDSEASARATLSDAILRLVQPVEVPT